MPSLLDDMLKTITSGLRRSTMTKCSDWSQEYRVMGNPYPGRLSFEHFPWAKEMHDCQAEMMVGQKAAQMAYTETAMNRVFHAIDIMKQSVLYVLPTKNDASDFSNSRFDPALEASPYLKGLFSDTSNMGHKRAGTCNLFIRGSRSESGLRSVPCGILIFDEVDVMYTKNIPLAFERASGQLEPQSFLLSTPSYENMGINRWFKMSDQSIFVFKCPHCSRFTDLTFPDCLIISAESFLDPRVQDTKLICKECKHILDHEAKIDWLSEGVWAPQVANTSVRGFAINQLYSSTVTPMKLAIKYLRGKTNPDDEKEWYNSALGTVYEAKGARVTDKQLEQAMGHHFKTESFNGDSIITMGVDVGTNLHVEIDQWHFNSGIATTDVNVMATCQLLKEVKVTSFDTLDQLMRSFNVNHCVIDSAPERRKATEFAERWYGHVTLCNYTATSDKMLSIKPEEEHFLSADRTFWMDLAVQARFQGESILLPIDVSQEYKDHIQANVRIIEKNRWGKGVATYTKEEHVDDHFAHSRNYAEIALPLAVSAHRNEDIQGLF